MIRRPTHRSGTSLLEVLVGLGILAIGAISAFVLFPFAAINVSRALTDDRTTTCAITADGQLRDIHRTEVVERERLGAPSSEPYHTAMDTAVPLFNGAGMPVAPDQPSTPVFVDPMGIAVALGNVGKGGSAPATSNPTLIPRVTFRMITVDPATGVTRPAHDQNSLALRFCSQLDGLLFDEGGTVSTANANEMHKLRYNWLWVLQRPINRDRHIVRQQVVVFNRRAHLYAPPNCEAVHGAVYTGTGTPPVNGARFVPGENTITGVNATAEVSKGTWIMDGTIGFDDAGRVIRHAEWYRVTSVTEVPGGGTAFGGLPTLTLEVHKPIARADGLVSRVLVGGVNPYAYTGVIVVFPAVVEVFERPVLTSIGAP